MMNAEPLNNPYLPRSARVVEHCQESPSIFTLRLELEDSEAHKAFNFHPGQFNMLYLHGVGEVPISIVSDPEDEHLLDHTIRAVGRVTNGLARLRAGDVIGIRGPFGRGWPLQDAQDRDIVLLTGGLGCAPVVSVIHYVMRRRERFGEVVIMQGVKHADDLIWRDQYEAWRQQPDVQVLLAADEAPSGRWPWHIGRVTALLDQARFNPAQATVMMCGPEPMMWGATKDLLKMGLPESDIWISMERSMHCAIGHCGHCQYADRFVCKQGPVFSYRDIKDLFGTKGF